MSFQPGFKNKKIASLSLAFRTSNALNTNGVTTTTTLPATIQAGDIIIIFNMAGFTTASALVTPSGFTNVMNTTGGNIRWAAHYKLADGSDAGRTVNIMSRSSGNFTLGDCIVFSGGAAALSASTFGAQFTSGNPTAQTVTVGSAPLITLGFVANLDIIQGNVSSYTGRTATAEDAFITNDSGGVPQGCGTSYKIYNTAPANNTYDIGDTGSGTFLGSGYIAAS